MKRWALPLFLLLCASLPLLSQQEWSFSKQRLRPRPVPGYFGTSTEISGDTMVVGSTGSAYVYVRQGGAWRQQARLTSPDPERQILFGRGVAISGDTIGVTAGGNNTGEPSSGAVYLFVREAGTWGHQATITAPTPQDNYLNTIALSGDRLIVSSTNGVGWSGPALAHIYARHEGRWSLEAELTGTAGDDVYDGYGISVDLSGDTAVVGAFFDGPNVSGAVYVYVRRGDRWRQQAKLKQPGVEELVPNNAFSLGYSVAVSGNTVMSGAIGGSSPGVFVFVRDQRGWTYQTTLVSPDGSILNAFGASVALEGNRAVIGSSASGQDTAFLFERRGTSWVARGKLAAEQSHSDTGALEVDLSGKTVVLASGRQGQLPGAAYVFVQQPAAGNASAARPHPAG